MAPATRNDGDAEVARVLIDAGTDVEATAAPSAGVPGGTALLHAAVFGMTDVVDVLTAAGAQVHGIHRSMPSTLRSRR